MFAITQLIAMSFAFPDVCKTIVVLVVVPIPYPNIAMSMMHIPNNFKHFIVAGPVHNLLTPGTISNGNDPGVATGIVSNVVIGPNRYMLGSFKVFYGVAPAVRMTSLTGQNGPIPNMVGAVLIPSQPKVVLLG